VGKLLAYWVPLCLAAGLAFLMAVLAADTGRRFWWGYATVGVACTVFVLVLPATRTHFSDRNARKLIDAAVQACDAAEARATDAEMEAAEVTEFAVELQARFNSAIGDIISPIATELSGLSCQSLKLAPERLGAVMQQIVDAAVTLCGGDGVRAAVYVLGRTPDGKPSDLQRRYWGGRQDPPRMSFSKKRGDARERAVHELVANGAYDLQEDVGTMPDTVLYRGKHYRSFVAVAIAGEGPARGMLAVDAPEIARFDRTHLGILLALAALASIALSSQVRRVDVDLTSDVSLGG
jgi:hypothetical protein